jgi:hypothetical protein
VYIVVDICIDFQLFYFLNKFNPVNRGKCCMLSLITYFHHINGKTTKAVLQSINALFNDLQLYSNSHCYEISRLHVLPTTSYRRQRKDKYNQDKISLKILKVVTRIRKSKNEIQYNDQKKRDKQ